MCLGVGRTCNAEERRRDGSRSAAQHPLPGCPAPLLPSPGLRSDPVQGLKSSPTLTLTQTLPKSSPKVTLTQALQVRHILPQLGPLEPHIPCLPPPEASAPKPPMFFLCFLFFFLFCFFSFVFCFVFIYWMVERRNPPNAIHFTIENENAIAPQRQLIVRHNKVACCPMSPEQDIRVPDFDSAGMMSSSLSPFLRPIWLAT